MNEDYIDLIRSLVWDLHRRYNIDWEELFAEATLIYLIKVDKYDESRGVKKSTWIYTCIKNRLLNFIKEEQRNTFMELSEVDLDAYSENPILFFELLDYLSEESKLIVDMVLETPHKYIVPKRKMARGLVVKNLISSGWAVARSWGAVRRLRDELVSFYK